MKAAREQDVKTEREVESEKQRERERESGGYLHTCIQISQIIFGGIA